MTYAERVPHPVDDAEREPAWVGLVLLAGAVALAVYFAWRAGWFRRAGVAAVKIPSGPPNPFGWR